MRKIAVMAVSLALFTAIHQGISIAVSYAMGEFDGVSLTFSGLVLDLKTPVYDRIGIKWVLFSASPLITTLCLGYVMLAQRKRLSSLKPEPLKHVSYWLTLMLMLLNPLRLCVAPQIVGSEVGYLAAALGVHRLPVQALFGVFFIINRELIARKLFIAYGVQIESRLWRPGFSRKG